MYNVSADSSIVPSEIQDNFDEKLLLTDLNSTSFAISSGYMYTFVWRKHFYITASLIPSLGINLGDYKTDFRQPYNTHLYLGLKTMNSIGYNSERIFGGIQFATDFFNTRIEIEYEGILYSETNDTPMIAYIHPSKFHMR